MRTTAVAITANFGSRTAIPAISRRSARAANGSLPPTPMGRRSSLYRRPERLTPSVSAISSISPDSQTGTWASLKSFSLTNRGAPGLFPLNAVSPAADFSLFAVRLSRVRQLVRRGTVRARVDETALGHFHRVVRGVQRGIPLASLALGAPGESTLAAMIRSLMLA